MKVGRKKWWEYIPKSVETSQDIEVNNNKDY